MYIVSIPENQISIIGQQENFDNITFYHHNKHTTLNTIHLFISTTCFGRFYKALTGTITIT